MNKKPHPLPRRLIDDPDHWRKRSEETRTLGESMADPKARAAMLRIADDYERLAQYAERRLNRGK